jgi:hypothetical protein
MSLTEQPAAYHDCYLLFERAVASAHGVRTPFPSKNDALYFQLRMNKARQIQRAMNTRAYPREHPLYGTSEFDGYKVVLREDGVEWWVYVEVTGVKLDYIEELEPEGTTQWLPHPNTNLMLTGPQSGNELPEKKSE